MTMPMVDGLLHFFGKPPRRAEPHDTAAQREEAAAALKLLQYRVEALSARTEKEDRDDKR